MSFTLARGHIVPSNAEGMMANHLKTVGSRGLSEKGLRSGTECSQPLPLALSVLRQWCCSWQWWHSVCSSLKPHRLIMRWPQAGCFCQTRSFGLAVCSLAYRVTGKPKNTAAHGCLVPPWELSSKEPACNAGAVGPIPESGGFPGERNHNPLQYPCLGNPMDRGT